MQPSVDVVVPVFNEEANVDEFYRRLSQAGYATSLIVVDNASTDRTVERLQRYPGVRLIRHESNLGYGASIRDGIAACQGNVVVIIDADLEYPPEAIPDLLVALEHHSAVYASRFLSGQPGGMPFLRRLGNGAISSIFNVLFRQRTTDLYTGMKGIRRDALRGLVLEQNGFEHVLELSARLAMAGHRIHEIPVTYVPRAVGVSKMRHIPETLKYLWLVARYRLQWSRRPAQAVTT
ncbi:MAG TPA: glycosyltransferase family 2 protein [Vicinamibacterales bacterium]|nr:glycosyltransferase family 2 protein [Vicinamibacterales bacterium]